MRPRAATPTRLDQAVTRILVRLGGLAAIAVVVAVGVIVWRTALLTTTSTYVSSSGSLAEAHAGMLDMETGLRGYLASGTTSYLDPYEAGRSEVAEGDASLEQLLARDPTLLDSYLNVRLAQDAWLTQWASPALSTTPVTVTPAFLATGKQLFDTYRSAEAALSGNLEARTAQAQGAASIVGNVGLLVEIPIALAGCILWWRSRQRLRRRVVGPVNEILASLERIGAGDFTAPAELRDGPAELVEITRRLSGIAATLEASREVSARREREAAEHAARLRGIVDMGREIAGSLNLRYVLQAVSHSVLGIGCGTRSVIWLTDEAHGTLNPVYDSAGLKGRVAGLEPIALGDQTVGKAARFGRVVGPEAVSHPDVVDPWPYAIAVPMIVGVRVVGVIEVGAAERLDLPTGVLELIDTLSSQAATAIEAARLYERAEQQSRTDALTLLPNRHDLDATLASEVSRADRYGRSLAVAMVDLDHFKEVNDSFGHSRGDEVLQAAATVMRNVLRSVDTIYRYGGEEFLVLMPETAAPAALDLCERLRAAVSAGVTLPDGRGLTVSVGVASFPEQAATPAALVAAADGALYRAKREGRDRVVAAVEPAPAPADGAPPRLVTVPQSA